MFENFSLSNIWQSDGILISVVGYVIVFAALLILFLFISNLKNLLNFQRKKKLKEAEGDKYTEDDLSISGEVSAAISTALHLHFAEIHDFENTVLTIKKVQKSYSPWSSKIYGLRQTPGK